MRFSVEALCLLVCILLFACSAKAWKHKHEGKDNGKTNIKRESDTMDLADQPESNTTDLAHQLDGKHIGSFGEPLLEELVSAGQKTLLLTVARSNLASYRGVIINIEALKGIADVGVLVIGAPARSELATQWEGVVDAAKTAGVVFRIRAPPLPHKHSLRGTSSNSFVAKLFFQMRARDWISLYDYVWMADSDILFNQFDYAQFWLSHQNSFLHGPPLIAQPLIRQNTQLLIYGFNMDQWSKALGANYTQYVATNINVEQQIPIFKAKFLVWLLDRLRPLLDKQLEQESDRGAAKLWCGAAAHYITNSDDQNHTSCGIVLVPIDHADTKTIRKDPGFKTRGDAVMAYIENSTHPEWSKWLEVKSLGHGVVFGPPNDHFTPMNWTIVKPDIELST
ncbi:hypothetical protein B484DRAFT_452411 [Ochromonadaceae sp. CCMP2298]|nr:hypothetical protein B484DRAFT_452411 [Ochromonadaceae sp. CCMP2298]